MKNTDTGESDVRCGMYTDIAQCLVNYLSFCSTLPSFLRAILCDSVEMCYPRSYMSGGYEAESRLKVTCSSGVGCYENSLSHV